MQNISYHTSLFSPLQISWCTLLLVYSIPIFYYSYIFVTVRGWQTLEWTIHSQKSTAHSKNKIPISIISWTWSIHPYEKAPLYSLTCSKYLAHISMSLYSWHNSILQTQPIHTNLRGRDWTMAMVFPIFNVAILLEE